MKFRHTFHVFVDNFSTTYKLLLYKLVLTLITAGLCCAILIPMFGNIVDTPEYVSLHASLTSMWEAFINFIPDELHRQVIEFREALDEFIKMLGTMTSTFVLSAVLLAIVYLINRFLSAIGTYTVGSVVNDKMALRARSSFLYTMTKNLGKASLFSVIYVPICFIYDVVCVLICALVVSISPMLVKFFAFTALMIVFSSLKNTFLCDWLPAVVHGKMSNGAAIGYALSRNGKDTAYIFSNLLIIQLIIFAMNVAALVLTFGAGLLITLPASYLILTIFQFVNYYDGNGIRYFLDEDTIVGPEREKPLTREEFFKGVDN